MVCRGGIVKCAAVAPGHHRAIWQVLIENRMVTMPMHLLALCPAQVDVSPNSCAASCRLLSPHDEAVFLCPGCTCFLSALGVPKSTGPGGTGLLRPIGPLQVRRGACQRAAV
jgi:hypothetical protein